jgi:rubrerythrin
MKHVHYSEVELENPTEEGLKDIAARIRAIAIAETHHEERYKKLLKEVEAGTVFKKTKQVIVIVFKVFKTTLSINFNKSIIFPSFIYS